MAVCKANGEGLLRSSWRWGLGVGEGSAQRGWSWCLVLSWGPAGLALRGALDGASSKEHGFWVPRI